MKLLKYLILFIAFLFVNNLFAQTTISFGVNPSNPICAGTGVTFTAQANNCSSPQFQWLLNGNPIPGATSSTYFSNALNNGDVINVQQTNTTFPCSFATANSKTMTVYYPPTLTLTSASGTNNQTVCQFENIDTIKYLVTGSNISMSISGLPSGVTTSYVGGIFKIFGAATQTGTFNYTLTASTSPNCGSAQMNGSFNIKAKIIPSLVPGSGSSTTLSTFNGQDYLVRCNSTSLANVILANGLSPSDQSQITQYKIVWGDGSPDTTFNSFTTNIIHSYVNGTYTLTISATNSSGCIGVKTYGVFVGNSPSGNLANLGNLSGCIPKTIKFPINNTAGNIPGTRYVIKFGDGDSVVYTHPVIPDTVIHPYIRTSCGNVPSTGPTNTFAATLLVTNPCGSATSTVSNIEINEPPTPNFALIPRKICNDKTVTIINTSSSGFVVTNSGCKNSAVKYWTISPSSGWTSTNNFGSNGGNPNDIDLWTNGDSILTVNFTQPGSYIVTIYLGNGCSGIRTKTDTITVYPNPPAPTVVTPVIYCQNYPADTLTATPLPGHILKWYTVANGGVGSFSSPTPSTSSPGNTTYWVSQVTPEGCEGPRIALVVTVNPTPIAPLVTTPIDYCQNATSTSLTATGSSGNTIKWYTQPSGGTSSSTAPTPSTAVVGTFSFFVTQTNSFNCESPRAEIVVNINPNPTAPTVTSPIIYCQNSIADTLTATTSSGNSLLWYTTPSGGTASTSSPTPSTTTVGSTDYYVSQITPKNCEGPRAQITVTIQPTPTAPSVTSPVVYCQGASTVPLQATPNSGNTILWYTVATGGTSSTTAPTPSSAVVGTTNYYASQINSFNCESPRSNIVVTINLTPTAPTVSSPIQLCQNQSASPLTATPSSGNSLLWYANSTGGIGNSTAPTPSTTTLGSINYYVSQLTPQNCEGPRAQITVTVNPVPNISNTTFTNPTQCALADGSISLYGLTASTTYTINYTKNGTPQTATITANSSGVATLTNLLAGIYANIIATLNNCSSNVVGPITLSDPNPPNTPTITAVNNICSGNTLNLAASTTTGGTATYTWSGPNGFSSSNQNPTITSISTAYSGTYSVTVTINNCTSAAGTKNIVVDSTPQQPTITANSPVCKDSTLFFSATTASPGTMTYNWTGPNSFTSAIQSPSISGATNVNAGVYSVIATSTANCISQPQTVNVQVNPAPVINTRNDTIYNDNVNSGTINFSANLPGTQFIWTNNNTSIGLAASGNDSINFTTSNPTANPIFGIITVTPILNGCPGLPFTFKITVNPSPKLSSPLKDSICTNNVFTYQATSATNNVKYTWVRNVVAGISNAANSSTDSTGLISEVLFNTTTAPVIVTYQFKLYFAGVVGTQNVQLIVYPKAKASFTYIKDTLCAPALIDSSIIKLIQYDSANISYEWYANNVLIGTTNYFPGYTINNTNDSVKIKLKAISKYGCLNDSFEHKFYTYIKPLVSFTKNKTQGCGPLSVTFTNTSTPLNLPKYLWVFGNGDSSYAIQPPTIIFKEDTNSNRKDTVYYIKLYAYTVCDTLMYLDSVIVHPKPKALFQPNATTGCSVFAFSAVNNSWGSGNSYYWDFGDNTNLVDTSKITVTHNYTTLVTDTFTVKLVATNVCGSDSFAVNIVVFPNTIVPKLILDGNNNYSCAPATLKFVNNSTGANKYTINFDDGSLPLITFKSQDTIYHTFNSGGIYNVTMKAENNCTDSTVTLTVQLYNKPTASFTTTSNQYCKKQPIVFTNTSNTGLSFEWIFGDGSTSNAYSPTYTYNTAGPYTVTLIARSVNPSGAICTDTARKTITINELPSSAFTDNAVVNNCQPFNFIGVTTQPVGNISNWTFTDPTSADTTMFGNTGTHTFFNPGTFNIKLIVFTPAGCSDTTNKTIKVVERPKASFTMSDTVSCVPGKIVTFTNNYTYNSLDAVNFEWYVDGVFVTNTRNLIYTFVTSINITTAKTFVIKSFVTNSFGCRDSMTKTFTVLPKAKPSFTINATNVCNPITLQLTNTSQYANIYKWYLDGQLFSNVDAPNPLVLNNPSTTYTIKLVADHTLGCGADSTVQQFTTPSNPIADFNIPVKTSCTGTLDIQCNNASSVVGANIIKWFWNFGDGTTSTLTNTTNTYTVPGRYNVSLQVQDDRGCLSIIKVQTVTNFGKPKSNFSINNACVFNPAVPVNLSTPGFGSTAITNYLWNFGDGTFLTGLQPIHVYQSEGLYTINLITTSDSSCVADTFSQKIIVYGKPIADFKYKNNCVQLNTFFSNNSIAGYGQNNIANSKWSFGDGGSGTNLNATHIYNSIGNYTVKLIVAGNQCPNLVDSVTKVVPILKGRDPVVYPRVDGIRGVAIQLNALSGGVGYLWNPNLGLSSDIIQNPTATYGLSAPNIINYNIEITDSIGCTVTDKQTVWLFAGSDVYLPSAFSPNGDGANDLFKPLYVNIYRLQYFRIFDRWGKLLFETSDMNKAWDGNFNGQPLPVDTYAWVIYGNGENGKEVIRKGNVTLIRNK